jgi:putative membrane-bound dehydrogenase-like protein
MNCRQWWVLLAIGLSLLPFAGTWGTDEPRPLKDLLPRLVPKAPTEALKTFRVLDGFRMDLVACEPQVMDPVAAAYDEDGRLYVVEMRDYPDPHKPGEVPLGRVRLLEDRDGDGVYETATILADGLPWPTGIACWDGGVYVTAAPDIWYFKDTDGDGKADVRKKVYTGFVVYNVQALVNGLQWGVDNHLYGVTAANGGEIRPADKPDAPPVPIRGRDFRFDPRTGRFEAVSGTAQFGNAFDDWYRRFLSANRLVTGHVVLPIEALARNPYLPAARAVQDCAAEGVDVPLSMFQISPAEPWREVRTRRYHEEGVKLPLSEMVVTGVFTSGTGITIYRGAAYPERYHGQAFVGNVAGNLVHRRALSPHGATFIATRIDKDCEFVASTDNWFRPVNFVNAPDGTLHVLDMYREVVEHPWSIPDDIKAHLDLTSGRDLGRIYRLTPPGFKPSAPPRLGRASTEQLVATLENPNAWWRETAQRLLYQRQDRAAVAPLRRLARESQSSLARMHALWTLEGLNALEVADIVRTVHDPAAGLREHALRLAEPRLKDAPELAAAVRAAADDSDARVRFQVAIALGLLPDDAATQSLVRIARRDAADPWARLAVLTSAAQRSDRLFAALWADASADPGEVALLGQLAAVVGTRNKADEVGRVLGLIADSTAGRPQAVRRDLLLGLGDGVLRTGKTLNDLTMPPAARGLLDELVREAQQVAANDQAAVPERAQAIQLLAHAAFEPARPTFRRLLGARQPQEVQLAAVRALRSMGDAGVPALLLDAWTGFTPPVRGEAVATLSSRAPWALALLDAVASQKVPATHIDSSRRTVLLKHRDAKVRAKAAELLGDAARTPRSEVVARYKPALDLKGDAKRGVDVFKRECASCHLAGGMGQNVGPSIASGGVKTPEEYLVAVLDPNREVDPRYLNYTVHTTDGRVTSGVIAAETPAAVTLKRADGATETVLRAQIEELTSTGQSLMPEGLEQKINAQEMADLIAFLLAVARGVAP